IDEGRRDIEDNPLGTAPRQRRHEHVERAPRPLERSGLDRLSGLSAVMERKTARPSHAVFAALPRIDQSVAAIQLMKEAPGSRAVLRDEFAVALGVIGSLRAPKFVTPVNAVPLWRRRTILRTREADDRVGQRSFV